MRIVTSAVFVSLILAASATFALAQDESPPADLPKGAYNPPIDRPGATANPPVQAGRSVETPGQEQREEKLRGVTESGNGGR